MTARFGLVERRLQTLATTSDAVCCGRRDIVALNPWQFVAVLLALTASLSGQTVQPEKSRSHPSPDAQAKVSPYQSIGNKQRVQWFVESTIGPQSLAGGIFSAGFGTAANTPKEYGGTWEGFGKRYGMRLTGISTGNAIEAGAGSLWGEDPRYSRANGEAFGGRLRNIVKLTFGAYRSNGELAPAYARYIAISGNNFLSNTWRARSESNAGQAALRTLLGFAGRMGSNAFQEFWPGIKRRVFHRKVGENMIPRFGPLGPRVQAAILAPRSRSIEPMKACKAAFMFFLACSKLPPWTEMDNSAQTPFHPSSSGQNLHSMCTEVITGTFTAWGCIAFSFPLDCGTRIQSY